MKYASSLAVALGVIVLWLAWREFHGMLVYELYRRGYYPGGLLGWAKLDADDCEATERPVWPKVDMLVSFWAAHPCMTPSNGRNGSSCNSLTTAGAGASSFYPLIWENARHNHAVAARLNNVKYRVGGRKTPEFHGPGMHALCEKIRYIDKLLLSSVAHMHWLVLIDADAGFRCAAVSCASRANETATGAGDCGGLEQSLNRMLQAAWQRRKADPSLLVFSGFGFFAVRNDAPTRALFARWTRSMVTRPFMCLFSTVPDVAAFHTVYGDHGDAVSNARRRCKMVYAPHVEREMTLHAAGQSLKRDKAAVHRFLHALNLETQCMKAHLDNQKLTTAASHKYRATVSG